MTQKWCQNGQEMRPKWDQKKRVLAGWSLEPKQRRARQRMGSPSNKGGTSPTSKIDGVDHPRRSQMAFLSPSAVVFSRSVFSTVFSIDFRWVLLPQTSREWAKIVQRSAKNQSQTQHVFRSLFWSILEPSWGRFGWILGPKMEPKLVQNRSQERSWSKCKYLQNHRQGLCFRGSEVPGIKNCS